MVYVLTNDEPIHVQQPFVVAKLVHRLLFRSFPVYHTVQHAPWDFTDSHSNCHGISPSTFSIHRATDLLRWTVCRYRWGRLTHCHTRATAQLYPVPCGGDISTTQASIGLVRPHMSWSMYRPTTSQSTCDNPSWLQSWCIAYYAAPFRYTIP